MNQIEAKIEEDTSSDSELGAETPVIESNQSEFIRPVYRFKGAELFHFTYGYELLFTQCRDPEDTGLFTWLAFVFLLRKRRNETPDEHRRWAISIAWKVSEFRERLITWMDEHGPFTNEDKLEAKRIYEESMKAAIATAVEAIPGRGARTTQKKMPRRKKPSLSTS